MGERSRQRKEPRKDRDWDKREEERKRQRNYPNLLQPVEPCIINARDEGGGM